MRILILVLILAYILPFELKSQAITIGQEKVFNSKILKEEREYAVFIPDDYNKNKKQSYPVLYVLDGHEYFWLAASTVRYLANRGYMPQTIVVGIYTYQNRDRDLTPSKDEYSPNGGGAEVFHSFLKEEFLPLIEAEYRTQNHRTLYGASLGGLFAMYVLYNHTNSFDNYLAISPSLFHDKGLVFHQGMEFFKKKNEKNKFVFLSLADESWTEMRVNFNNTISLFKSKANESNINWAYKYYDSETHGTTKLVGLNDGLRNLHYHWFVPFYQRDKGIQGIKEHYKLLNATYNYPIEVPEKTVNRIAYNLLREKKIEEAKSCFEFNVQNYSNSPNVFDSMGDFYSSIENWTKAEKYYSLAVEKARKKNLQTVYYEKNLNRIKDLINRNSKSNK